MKTSGIQNPLNVVVQWLALLPCIREVLCSNLGLETGYPDLRFSCFFSVPPGKCLDSILKLGNDFIFPNPFRFITHLSPSHSTLCSLSYLKSS
jgi:hypothetical protein